MMFLAMPDGNLIWNNWRPSMLIGIGLVCLTACGTLPVAKVDNHLKAETWSPPSASTKPAIPAPIRHLPLPPPPQAQAEEIRYSITVNDVPVHELLFAISRDTHVNIDIHPGIEGRVTLNAIDQSLKQILTRIARQIDMRWEMEGPNIAVRKDTPYLKNYKIDYVNMARETTSTISVATQVASPGQGAQSGGSGAGSSASGSTNGANNSTLQVKSLVKNNFWEDLAKNIKDILIEEDKQVVRSINRNNSSARLFQDSQNQVSAAGDGAANAGQSTAKGGATAGASGNQQLQAQGSTNAQVAAQGDSQRIDVVEANPVIANPESGVINVRATSRQHEKIAEFLARVMEAARRQVLIEATVVEVLLSDNYQSGVDWSALGIQGMGYSFSQNFTGGRLGEGLPAFTMKYSNPNAAAGGSIASTLKLLNSFGTTRVLSSPKIMALNNQTAILKVVDNRVYFTIKANTVTSQTGPAVTTYETVQNVVPVGFLMNVTPHVTDENAVVLNIRPTVSRILGYVDDPNPDLARAKVISRIPEIQTRELESVMKVSSGQIAVLGGLMQDSFESGRDGLPILSRIPLLGDGVSYRNDTGRKSELVVFIRPLVLREANVNTDLAEYKKYLPDAQFFRDPSPSFDPQTGRLNEQAPLAEPLTGKP